MRRILQIMSWLSLLSLLACSETQKTGDKQIPPDKQLVVKLDIESDHLEARLSNRSSEAIRVWESNGFQGWLHLRRIGQGDTVYRIQRSERDWTMIGPTPVNLHSGQSFKFQLNLKDRRWVLDEELSILKDESILVQAVYNALSPPEVKKDSVFVGTVYSEWVVSRPPHLWLFPVEEEDSRHKGVVLHDMILDLDNLKLIDSDEDLNIVWNINDEARENYDLYPEDSVIVVDEKGTEYNVSAPNKIVDNSIVGYIIKLKQKGIGGNIWEYSPKRCNGSGSSLKCIVDRNKLFVAVYCGIASGSDLVCVDMYSGKEIWRGEIQVLLVPHSQYRNLVLFKLIGDKIVFAGVESGGNYIQVIDANTGANLFSKMGHY